MRNTIAVGLAILALCEVVTAQDIAAPCNREDMSMVDVGNCLDEEYAKVNAVLRVVYDRMSPAQRAKVKSGQERWLAEREAIPKQTGLTGNHPSISYLPLQIAATKSRIAELRQIMEDPARWTDESTGAASGVSTVRATTIDGDLAKQRKTMADLRSVATATEAYSVDHNTYPKASTMEELRLALEPTYIRSLPLKDGWGRPFVVTSEPMGYTFRSYGRNGELDSAAGGATSSLDADIIFRDGQFTQWPEGQQH